jgi:hypothetical protein
MRSRRAGCAYADGANFDLSNITKNGRRTPKRKLINQLVRLSGTIEGCKLPSAHSNSLMKGGLGVKKMAPEKPAPWLKTDPV